MRVIISLFLLLCSFPIYAFSLFQSTYSEPVKNPVFSEKIGPIAQNAFMFDPNYLQWAVYNKAGERVGMGKGVGGKNFCSDINKPCRTVSGNFTVFRKEDKDCTSKTFPIDEGGGAPMPHCMFFHKGYAIHGSSHLPAENASHGCIRVSQQAALWMNKNYIHEGASVIVRPYDEKIAT